jgi:hypothetical protein
MSAAKKLTSVTLPPNWKQKVSYDGRVYFHNHMTDQTTWKAENIASDGVMLTVSKAKRASYISSP